MRDSIYIEALYSVDGNKVTCEWTEVNPCVDENELEMGEFELNIMDIRNGMLEDILLEQITEQAESIWGYSPDIVLCEDN